MRGTRWTFTVSGPVTNLAARLAATAGAGQLVVGAETVRRLGDRYGVERLGCDRLKNLGKAVEMYRLADPMLARLKGEHLAHGLQRGPGDQRSQ